ncbi:hypothetical protein B0H17DRAFT_1051772 [Mycena rosella]|uniref:Uncharacterized protein n=1 Tax=Mycena rosella TaxID=1033263 RepID=A0AAD7GJA9_MYCRO|nr:hypothetical protein B0H17DRAFT_1051772 [Mycena rosella]
MKLSPGLPPTLPLLIVDQSRPPNPLVFPPPGELPNAAGDGEPAVGGSGGSAWMRE